MDTSTVLLLAAFVILVAVLLTKRNGRKTLPGPIGLPIVGYLPFMTGKPHLKLTELAKTYGPVYSIRLGSKDIVVICDHHLIKEAFAKDDFSGRPFDSVFLLSPETIRTEAVSGLPFKEQRRFSLHMLRDLGFGKTRMEGHMQEEIQELVDQIDGMVGKPVEMTSLLTGCAANNISSLLFGRRLKINDPVRKELTKQVREVSRLAGAITWHQFFPWLRVLIHMFFKSERQQLAVAMESLRDYVRKEMAEHEKTLDPNNIRDFMDGFLLEIQKKKGDTNSTFQKDVLIDTAVGFYGAGSSTVRITTEWLLLLCAKWPEVQKKVHKEIDEVLGSDRFVTGLDRANMPYTEAVICEIMRWKSAIPLNLLRRTLKDTEIDGYFIPKDTDVLAVFWVVDHDKKIWGDDAMSFKPERFLSEDGKKLVKPDYYFPFSTGKRSCPGKPLGEVEVFLFFVTLLQNFNVSAPAGKELDMEGFLGIGLEPTSQEIVFQRRNSTKNAL